MLGGGSQQAHEQQVAALQSPAAAADPFAFDMSAFGSGLSSSNAEAAGTSQAREPKTASTQATASAKDPFAFDMSAFGSTAFGDGAETAEAEKSSAHAEEAAVSQSVNQQIAADLASSSAPPNDPYAFELSAFGLSGRSLDSQVAKSGAVSGDLTQAAASTSAPGDPFAFSPNAFGFGDTALQPTGVDHAAEGSGRDPFAADKGAPEQATPSAAAAACADPFAFSMDAFGLGGTQQECMEPDMPRPGQPGRDPFAADRAELEPEQATAPASASDPFAFSMGAFGLGGDPSLPEEPEPGQHSGQDPFAADRGIAPGRSLDRSSSILSGTLDPGAFGMGGSDADNLPLAQSRNRRLESMMEPEQDTLRPSTPKPLAPGRLQAGRAATQEEPARPGQPAASASSQPRQQPRHEGQSQSSMNSRALQKRFDAPKVEPFVPLSSRELDDLERLLKGVAAVPDLVADASGRPLLFTVTFISYCSGKYFLLKQVLHATFTESLS